MASSLENAAQSISAGRRTFPNDGEPGAICV
jgi:hypothetical protein